MGRNEESLKNPIIQFFKEQGYMVVSEWRTPYAVPDVLAVKPNQERVMLRLNSKQRVPLNREIYWRILDALPDEGDGIEVSMAKLSKKFGLSYNYLKNKIIKHLERGNYVKYCRENYLVKLNGFHPYSDEIITVEAKISKWRKAGEQAIRHQQFSNKSYVALDKRYLHRALKFISSFEDERIGILSVDENEQVELVLEAPFTEPNYRFIHYLVLEQFWDRIIKNGDTHVFKFS